jgi:hypothetical protein
MHFKGLKMFHIKAQKYLTPVSTKVTTHNTHNSIYCRNESVLHNDKLVITIVTELRC